MYFNYGATLRAGSPRRTFCPPPPILLKLANRGAERIRRGGGIGLENGGVGEVSG